MSDDAGRSMRDAKAPGPTSFGVGSRWAVIVGVSSYQDSRLNLEFAADDARELAALIQTPTGGGFPEGNVLLLVDHQATSLEVIRALRSFLMKPSKEDLVLIYFACHGGPDPRRPSGPLYLFTHDTERADIAATAVPMDEIQGALRDSLLSERVVVIADTCHSGNLGSAGTRAAANSAEATNSYLSRLAESKPGVALLTSCEAAESSQEHQRWGGGHGVFTWHLLEGMRGAADGFGQQKDGIVGVGELFEYVRDRVRADTQGAQHPSVGSTSFDRDLPMAATGDLDVQRHLTLAHHLIELGWLTDDPAAFICAERETAAVDELTALTGTRLAASTAMRAEALMATDRPEEAVAELGTTPTMHEETRTDLVRGVALAATEKMLDAAAALTRFASRDPGNPESVWAADFAAALELEASGTRHALLVGAGTIEALPGSNLRGTGNDVMDLADHLIHRLGFPENNVVTLTDDDASRSKILGELNRLAVRARPADVIVVYFTGHSTIVPADETLFVTFDTRRADDGASWMGGIRGSDFVAHLANVPGGSKLLIVDSAMRTFDAVMSDQHGWIVIGPGPGQIPREVSFDGEFSGVLSRALLETWPTDEPQLTCGALAAAANQWLRKREFNEVLTVYGDPDAAAVSTRFGGAPLWRQARDRSHSPVSADEIERLAPSVGDYGQAAWALARTRLEKGRTLAAVRSFDEARRLLGTGIPQLEVDRIRALLGVGRTNEGISALADTAKLPEVPTDIFTAGAAALTDVVGRRARALIVGIDAYAAGRRARRGANAAPTVRRPAGARADAESFAATLTRNGVVAPEDVVLLLDEDATRERILAAFETLATHGVHDLAIFHFAGLGSWAPDQRPTILSVDARTMSGNEPVADIALTDLAARSVPSPNLVAIIDVGSTALPAPTSEAEWDLSDVGLRVAPPADGAVSPRPTSSGDDLVIGAVILAPAVPQRSKDRAVERAAGKSRVVRGRLTLGVERALAAPAKARRQAEPVTYQGLIATSPLRGRASASGRATAEPILRHRTAIAAADASLRELELRPVRSALALASTLISEAATRHESAPLALLEAGLALDALGAHEAATHRLRAARNLSDDESDANGRGATRDPHASEVSAWASHHLGRILYEHGWDLNEAVAALTTANQQEPDNARTSYHLGLAIYTLVQRESLREVQAHLQHYLDHRAPLGHVNSVEQIINSIESPRRP